MFVPQSGAQVPHALIIYVGCPYPPEEELHVSDLEP